MYATQRILCVHTLTCTDVREIELAALGASPLLSGRVARVNHHSRGGLGAAAGLAALRALPDGVKWHLRG